METLVDSKEFLRCYREVKSSPADLNLHSKLRSLMIREIDNLSKQLVEQNKDQDEFMQRMLNHGKLLAMFQLGFLTGIKLTQQEIPIYELENN